MLFERVKNSVTALQAARAYGLSVNRNRKALCPFHPDSNPSMKVDRRYYCFGCGATGDSIDLTAQLLGIGKKDAALRLANDFGIDGEMVPKPANPIPKGNWQNHAVSVLLEYRHLLKVWAMDYAPKTFTALWHPLFCEALSQRASVEFLLDELLISGKEDAHLLKRDFREEVERIEYRLGQFHTGAA